MMGDSAYKNTLDCFVKTLKNDVSSFSAAVEMLFYTPLLEVHFKINIANMLFHRDL